MSQTRLGFRIGTPEKVSQGAGHDGSIADSWLPHAVPTVRLPTPQRATAGVEAPPRVTRWNGGVGLVQDPLAATARGDPAPLPPRESAPPRRTRGVGGDGGYLRGGGRGVCLLALPLGALTAAWWLGTGREMPSLSHHLRRDRGNDSVLSSVSGVSVEADDVVAAGDRPADLISCTPANASTRWKAATTPHAWWRSASPPPSSTPPLAPSPSSTSPTSAPSAPTRWRARSDPADLARSPSWSRAPCALRTPRTSCASSEGRSSRPAAPSSPTRASPSSPCLAPSRRGDKWCGPRAGGRAGAEFRAALGKLPARAAQLCAGCDAEIEHNGPGVVDRWTAEVLVPARSPILPLPPRVLSLSSSHTALLCRHLGARDVLVGCGRAPADDDDADPSKRASPSRRSVGARRGDGASIGAHTDFVRVR